MPTLPLLSGTTRATVHTQSCGWKISHAPLAEENYLAQIYKHIFNIHKQACCLGKLLGEWRLV